MVRKRKGMTLVEIIVAMAVFAIVVMSILNVFPIVARLNVISKAGIDLTAIAQTEAERFYAYSRTNKYVDTLTNAKADTVGTLELNYKQTQSEDKKSDILTGYDSIKHVIVVVTFTNNFTFTGMTKISVLATIDSNYNYKGASSQQIDSILLFK